MGLSKDVRRAGRDLLKVLQGQDVALRDGIAAAKITPSCKKGCDHCCHQYTVASLLEAVSIAEHIRGTWTPEEISGLKKDIESDIALLQTMTRASYFGRAHPCLFLEDHTCSIYPVRPAACRHYMVVSDPNLCRTNSVEQVLMLNTHPLAVGVMKEILALSRDGRLLAENGIPFIAPTQVSLWWAFFLLEQGEAEFLKALAESRYGALAGGEVRGPGARQVDEDLFLDRGIRGRTEGETMKLTFRCMLTKIEAEVFAAKPQLKTQLENMLMVIATVVTIQGGKHVSYEVVAEDGTIILKEGP